MPRLSLARETPVRPKETIHRCDVRTYVGTYVREAFVYVRARKECARMVFLFPRCSGRSKSGSGKKGATESLRALQLGQAVFVRRRKGAGLKLGL